MTKLSDLRKQLRTGELEAELAESAGGAKLRHYTIALGGADALIKFGKYKGHLLSYICAREPAYMNWILESDFPSELKEVARAVLAKRDATEMEKAARDLEASFKGKKKK